MYKWQKKGDKLDCIKVKNFYGRKTESIPHHPDTLSQGPLSSNSPLRSLSWLPGAFRIKLKPLHLAFWATWVPFTASTLIYPNLLFKLPFFKPAHPVRPISSPWLSRSFAHAVISAWKVSLHLATHSNLYWIIPRAGIISRCSGFPKVAP